MGIEIDYGQGGSYRTVDLNPDLSNSDFDPMAELPGTGDTPNQVGNEAEHDPRLNDFQKTVWLAFNGLLRDTPELKNAALEWLITYAKHQDSKITYPNAVSDDSSERGDN
jgi:hypothetical protein